MTRPDPDAPFDAVPVIESLSARLIACEATRGAGWTPPIAADACPLCRDVYAALDDAIPAIDAACRRLPFVSPPSVRTHAHAAVLAWTVRLLLMEGQRFSAITSTLADMAADGIFAAIGHGQ